MISKGGHSISLSPHLALAGMKDVYVVNTQVTVLEIQSLILRTNLEVVCSALPGSLQVSCSKYF